MMRANVPQQQPQQPQAALPQQQQQQQTISDNLHEGGDAAGASGATGGARGDDAGKLLLRKQLHLELNASKDDVANVARLRLKQKMVMQMQMMVSGEGEGACAMETNGTVTTVPQQKQQQQNKLENNKKQQQPQQFTNNLNKLSSKKASSANKQQATTTTLKSRKPSSSVGVATATTTKPTTTSSTTSSTSTTALAKFNEIIDSTMAATNVYGQQQQQQQQQLELSGAPMSLPRLSEALQQRLGLQQATTTNNHIGHTQQQHRDTSTTVTTKKKKLISSQQQQQQHSQQQQHAATVASTHNTANTTMGRTATATATPACATSLQRNDCHYLLKQLNSFSDIEEIEIVDMEQRQQRVQLAQQHHQQLYAASQRPYVAAASPTATSLVLCSPSAQSHKGIRRYASLHQATDDDDPEEEDGYGDSEASDPTLATRSTSRGKGGSELMRRQKLLQQFDDYLFQSSHYLETNYIACNYRTAMVESNSHEFRPSTTTGTSTSAGASDEGDLEGGLEPPSVIYRAPLKTTSGCQTDFSWSQSSKSLDSSAESGASARPQPFFRCCYTPLDRWRERRLAAAAKARHKKMAAPVETVVCQQRGGSANGHAV